MKVPGCEGRKQFPKFTPDNFASFDNHLCNHSQMTKYSPSIKNHPGFDHQQQYTKLFVNMWQFSFQLILRNKTL